MHRTTARAATALLIAALVTSCKSTGSGGSGGSSAASLGPPPKVTGSSARPVDDLPRTEYPFDADGNYVASWAAEGDRKYAAIRASSSSRSRSSSSRSSSSSSRSRASSSSSSSRRHTVRRGDTLYGLARRYGTSVSSIKRANGLSSDTIRIGQSLRIP